MRLALLLPFSAACALAAAPALLSPAADRVPDVSISAESFAAGDSVRYVARFTVPDVDSVSIAWQLAAQQFNHSRKRPWNGPVADTARFAAPALSPGGSSSTGSVVIKTWRGVTPSLGVTKTFDAIRAAPPPPAAPPDVSNFAFVDSAVAYP